MAYFNVLITKDFSVMTPRRLAGSYSETSESEASEAAADRV
jgi:hypothetical protein